MMCSMSPAWPSPPRAPASSGRPGACPTTLARRAQHGPPIVPRAGGHATRSSRCIPSRWATRSTRWPSPTRSTTSSWCLAGGPGDAFCFYDPLRSAWRVAHSADDPEPTRSCAAGELCDPSPEILTAIAMRRRGAGHPTSLGSDTYQGHGCDELHLESDPLGEPSDTSSLS